jgi:predicted metal-dependent peptidase
MRQPGDPNVTVVVDTSGSISDDTLKETLTEVIGITRAVGHSGGIWVIPCDYVAYSAAKVRTAADVKSLKFPGGGGTDMRAGIRAALDSKQKPDVVVVVTDGFTPWPDEKPTGCDNFIVLLTEEAKRDSVPQWGKTVYLELDSD